ncbi:MAG TPA: glycerol-3-phosphate acyltransferase [Terriglobia bacterium]|nr:glycerol-3-phosphate acyltransferase [Terriglobia bacterium]
MNPLSFSFVLKVGACFVAGAIPFAKVAMLGTGIDITRVGSKNPGFNNVLRVSTKPRAAVALVGDIFKGLIALALLAPAIPPEAKWIMGIAAVMGHCWSPFLGWNGGKGVATTVGVMLFLQPWLTLACIPLYPLGRFIGRRIGWRQEGAISSVTTMTILATAVFVLNGPRVGIYAYAMLAIVVIRHIPNFREILGQPAQ